MRGLGIRPSSKTIEPPRGVLYADVRACDAARSGVGRLEDREECSEKVVVGVNMGDDGPERMDMGVGSLGDMRLGDAEGDLCCSRMVGWAGLLSTDGGALVRMECALGEGGSDVS